MLTDIENNFLFYPFRAPMPERTWNSGNYRYGFNAKENDNEVKGVGNQQDYGMRVYDPRLGKFLSVDPLTKDFPWYTPFQFSGSKPIWAVNLDGLEEFFVTDYLDANYNLWKTEITIATAGAAKDNAQVVHRSVDGRR
jgi:RHS repeat-associated protein